MMWMWFEPFAKLPTNVGAFDGAIKKTVAAFSNDGFYLLTASTVRAVYFISISSFKSISFPSRS